MTDFEKLLCGNILFIYIQTCVMSLSDDKESMTDTVLASDDQKIKAGFISNPGWK